jgi:hypothetical protein
MAPQRVFREMGINWDVKLVSIQDLLQSVDVIHKSTGIASREGCREMSR